MQRREIIVERKDHESVAGGTLHKVYCQGGEILTTFKDHIARELQVGKVYQVLVQPRGQYCNIIEVASAEPALFSEDPGEAPLDLLDLARAPEGYRAILVLASALVAAAQVKMGRQVTTQQILEIAGLFDKWAKGETGK